MNSLNSIRSFLVNILNLSIEDYISKSNVIPYNISWGDYDVVLWTHLPPSYFNGSFIEITDLSDMRTPQYYSIRTDNHQQLKLFPKAFPSLIKGVIDFR